MKQTSKLRRVGLTLAALVVTLVMTITTTYAWFTTSATPSVEGLDFTVTSGASSLMISYSQAASGDAADQNTFKSVLNASDYQAMLMEILKRDNEPDPTSYTDFKLGAFAVDQLSNDREYIVDDTGLTEAQDPNKVDAVKGGWLEYSIHFRSTSKMAVFFKGGDVQIIDSVATQVPVYAYEEIDLTKVKDHAGVSLTGDLAIGEPIKTSAGFALRMGFEGTAGGFTTEKIWNPSSAIGTYTSLSTSNNRTIAANFYVFSDAYNFALGYYNHTMQKSLTKPVSYAGDINTIQTAGAENGSSVLAAEAGKNSVRVCEVATAGTTNTQYYYATITVRVWIDGWDANCINAIFTDKFNVSYIFEGIVDDSL